MQGNRDNFDVEHWSPYSTANHAVLSLEQPHNGMHLTIGGFDIPNVGQHSPYAGANGDMGENDTASFDPSLHFHHVVVDQVLWDWQMRAGQSKTLKVVAGYPVTNSADEQETTPGVAADIRHLIDSPLDPFKKGNGSAYTSRESRPCIVRLPQVIFLPCRPD